jgi:hypothetical protein
VLDLRRRPGLWRTEIPDQGLLQSGVEGNPVVGTPGLPRRRPGARKVPAKRRHQGSGGIGTRSYEDHRRLSRAFTAGDPDTHHLETLTLPHPHHRGPRGEHRAVEVKPWEIVGTRREVIREASPAQLRVDHETYTP